MTTGQRIRRRILSGDNGCTWACRRARSSALGLAWYDTSHSEDTGDDKDGSMLGPTKQMSFRRKTGYSEYTYHFSEVHRFLACCTSRSGGKRKTRRTSHRWLQRRSPRSCHARISAFNWALHRSGGIDLLNRAHRPPRGWQVLAAQICSAKVSRVAGFAIGHLVML